MVYVIVWIDDDALEKKINDMGGMGSINDLVKVGMFDHLEPQHLFSSNNVETEKNNISKPKNVKTVSKKRKTPMKEVDYITVEPDKNIDDLVAKSESADDIDFFEIKKIVANENIKCQWIWGQINRLLPIKIALRVQSNLQIENGGKAINKLALMKDSSSVAVYFGKRLNECDDKKKRKKGERLSTGLPMTYKGSERFQTQIVFSERKRDHYYFSAIIDLGFANYDRRVNSISLTKGGFEFALLDNPILDGDIEKATTTLSREESEFYLTYVKKNIPYEWDAISWVTRLINDGVNTPRELDNQLSKECAKWSDDMVVTQRTGVIGRLTDLGILGKNKDGVKIAYFVTEIGHEMLAAL